MHSGIGMVYIDIGACEVYYHNERVHYDHPVGTVHNSIASQSDTVTG